MGTPCSPVWTSFRSPQRGVPAAAHQGQSPCHRPRRDTQESLQTRAVVRKLADAVKAQVHDLLADRVVAASVVVRRILLAGDQLLGVEKLAVRPRADLVHHRRLQVEEHRARHVLASAGLREERVERVVLHTNRLVGRHRTVGLDTVLQTEQLPARIANLATGLTDVNANRLTHLEKKEFI
ncbi:hypothetical protein C3747_266g55 [Trypanosoma cruzi]|uniref:Uncharacterized protein n=1 Tax=Trypanosoma cruzi TaxID=5693 RepID=A0A2V2VIR9_TRYCR|nr:hypothetical protein C3747_266g55 [Trypanosoma cruzi]